MAVVEEICDIERQLRMVADCFPDDKSVAEKLTDLAGRLSKLCVDASLTIEALHPIFETEAPRGGVLSVMDLCYNAFMIGRQQENREDGLRTSYFQDCQPLMLAGVERLKKQTLERMEYARQDNRRFVQRNTENTGTSLPPEQIDAGAACLYGHLDRDFSGGNKVSYPQASAHTKGKYQRAFASAVVASERVKAAA